MITSGRAKILTKPFSSSLLALSKTEQVKLITAARDSEQVRGLTHGFYKYPARFSPSFARAVIETFTQPGDLVLDNHVGGGTTLVESIALGRHAIGVDISPLAEFVAKVKCTVLDEAELDRLVLWSMQLREAVNIHRPSVRRSDYAQLGYYKHLNHATRWRLRKAIEQALARAISLRSSRLEAFGRCVVLRAAQWALDSRRKLPSIDEFRDMLTETASEMIDGARQLREAVTDAFRLPDGQSSQSLGGWTRRRRAFAPRHGAKAGSNVASISWGACPISSVAGRWAQRSAITVYDC